MRSGAHQEDTDAGRRNSLPVRLRPLGDPTGTGRPRRRRLGGLDAGDAIGDRSLGDSLVHQLGVSQRWRVTFQTEGTGEGPEPERAPLPTIDGLRERWKAEWAVIDDWLPTVTDGFVGYVFGGVPVWQMLVHVVNHGTQYRAEAAALLTAEGHSPGELDLMNYAEELAANGRTGAVSG